MTLREADTLLLRLVDSAFATAATRAGAWLLCAPGCTSCCRGPFPITPLDAARLLRGLEELATREPAAAERVVRRAQAARETMTDRFPGDPASGTIEADDDALEAHLERHASLDCPALDPATGRCDLYAARPVPCRTYGPPVRLAGEDLPPCALCFDGAAAEAVEACRVEPDPHGLEESLLGRFAREGGGEGATFVAWALAAALPPLVSAELRPRRSP